MIHGCDFNHVYELDAKHLKQIRYCKLILFGQTISTIRLIYFLLKTKKLTAWGGALLEKPPVVQLLKKFPIFYGTLRFITVLTKTFHWPLS
jgi:hypothetical protein